MSLLWVIVYYCVLQWRGGILVVLYHQKGTIFCSCYHNPNCPIYNDSSTQASAKTTLPWLELTMLLFVIVNVYTMEEIWVGWENEFHTPLSSPFSFHICSRKRYPLLTSYKVKLTPHGFSGRVCPSAVLKWIHNSDSFTLFYVHLGITQTKSRWN